MRRLWANVINMLLGVGLLLMVLAAVAGGALWLTLPPTQQTLRIPGLSAPATIRFDADGVPRIQAANERDAAAALGYAHARDRMFQMELMRRAAAGRLSEIAGTPTLPLDRSMRTLGLARLAQGDYAALPDDTKAIIEAYATGVNAWITARGRLAAPEFLLLGAPEPWQPADSLLWAKTMGLWLSQNWRTELSRLALAGQVPQRLIDELWLGDHPARHAARQPDPDLVSSARRLAAMLPSFPSAYTQPASASNEWAVDGAQSASGAPLLAGDPHLAFGFPGLWYLVRIDTPNTTLAGATGPGVPFLVLGHNGHIAWTFTTTGADVQDVFIEAPEDAAHFTTRQETIIVRGQNPETLTIRESRHGPIMSDLDDRPGRVLAVAMANLQPGDTAATGLLALNRARSVSEAGAAAPAISSPVQNLLVADATRIGRFVTGRIPIRKAGDGSAPVPGDGSHDWVGWASGEALPHVIAPASGRLVNANERIAPPDFPVFLGRDWFGDWRARRIETLLDAQGPHTAAGFVRMQMDVRSAFALQILPILRATAVPPDTDTDTQEMADRMRRISPQNRHPRACPEGRQPHGNQSSGNKSQANAEGDPRDKPEDDGFCSSASPRGGHRRSASNQALSLLTGWEGDMTLDAPQPLIFNLWVTQFYRDVLQRAGIPWAHGGPIADFVGFVLSPAGAHWCGGDCGPMLGQALTTAINANTGRFDQDLARWRWGEAHKAVFAHPLLRGIPVLGWLTTQSIPSPGDDTTLNRGGPNAALTSVHGASFRAVYDLADLDQALFMIAPGQSGHVARRHARDLLRRWRDGDTMTLGREPATVTATIGLTP